jgi:hypothetical protein
MNIHVFIRRDPPPHVEHNLYVLLHDFECDDGNHPPYLPRVYGTKKGLPETEKCLNSNFERMNETWQRFWFELFKRFDNNVLPEERLKKRWANLTHGSKAFTNMHGSNTHRDYINGQNMEAEEMGQENVTTCGNVVLAAGEPVKKVSKMFLPVQCIDRNLPPPSIRLLVNLGLYTVLQFASLFWLIQLRNQMHRTENFASTHFLIWTAVMCLCPLSPKEE